jgi:predicted secreted protein
VRKMLTSTVLILALGASLLGCGSDGTDTGTGNVRSIKGDGNGAEMLVFKDPAAPIPVVAGQEFAIRLEQNASSGYEWTMTTPPSELVQVLEGEGLTSADDQVRGLVGVPGTTTFVFKAKASGTTPIEFTSARPSDPTDSPTVARFTINVS